MKKIALIMDGWKRYISYAWPNGILQRIKETNEDINLYIFNSSGNWTDNAEYNLGEYNIYKLPNLKEFDGIVLDLTNVTSKEVVQSTIKSAHAANVPVVSINDAIDDFYYAGVDDISAMRTMISHLHEKHQCRQFWFLMGETDNYQSNLRKQGLLEYLTEHQIPFSEECCYHGAFDYASGVHSFHTLWERTKKLPDAVICVNDNVAIGFCEAAAKHGFHAPEDFLITGFDNFDKADTYLPNITTVAHIRDEVGYLAADILLRVWAGENVPRLNFTTVRHLFRESCGCPQSEEHDIREHLCWKLLYEIETDEFDNAVLRLESEMAKCNTIEEMMYCIPLCIPSMKCDAMYLVLDDHISDYRKEAEKFNKTYFQLSDDKLRKKGYPTHMHIRFAYENGNQLDLRNKEVSDIFPMFESEESGTDFLFLPIHFGSSTAGYFVIRNAVYLMEKQYLFKIINALTTSMENLHKKEKLEYMNQKLSNLYMMDQLTGMYNRMGYHRLADEFFQILHRRGTPILVAFMDLDRLKYINDHFGHEYGDSAIFIASCAIRRYSAVDGIPARTGGDEFVLLQPYDEDEPAEEFFDNIRSYLREEAARQKLPFELSISIGYTITDPDSDKTLQDYVKLADSHMYAEKNRKKSR